MTPLFAVLDRNDWTIIGKTDDIGEAFATCNELDGIIAVVVTGPWFSALTDFMRKQTGKLDAEDVKYEWKMKRLAVRPYCDYCNRRIGRSATVDHRTPTSRGGANVPENFALACPNCNQSKGKLTVEEFRERVLSAAVFTECAEPREQLQTA